MNAISPRRLHAAAVPATLCLAALASLGFPGCTDLTGPGRISPEALTMSNCWPNDNGRYWQYQAVSKFLEYEAPEPLPPNSNVPEVSFNLARALLADPVTAAATEDYTFRMQFDGDITTFSGVTAQNLFESIPQIKRSGRAAVVPFGQRLLARIAQARPSLRARLGVPAGGEVDRGVMLTPNLIHGYAWIKGPLWIGSYGDVDTLLAWKFLESDVRPGHTFVHQLVPSLATDIRLLARVEGLVQAELPGGRTIRNALEVLYIVDYGVEYGVDAMGNPVSAFRTFDYGKVVYAPGVGPVSDIERRFAWLGQNVTHGVYELDLGLTETGVALAMLAADEAAGR